MVVTGDCCHEFLYFFQGMLLQVSELVFKTSIQNQANLVSDGLQKELATVNDA